MKDKLSTRYIGNVESWSDFWRQVVGCGRFYNFFGQEDGQNLIVEINKILANISLNQDFYKSKIKAYPFEVPNSFKDLWLSGTIDIFEIIFSYFEGYNNEFQPKKGVYYFKLFLNPEYVEQFKNLLKKKKNIPILAIKNGDDIAIESLPASVKASKPYVDNVVKHKNLYYKYHK